MSELDDALHRMDTEAAEEARWKATGVFVGWPPVIPDPAHVIDLLNQYRDEVTRLGGWNVARVGTGPDGVTRCIGLVRPVRPWPKRRSHLRNLRRSLGPLTPLPGAQVRYGFGLIADWDYVVDVVVLADGGIAPQHHNLGDRDQLTRAMAESLRKLAA